MDPMKTVGTCRMVAAGLCGSLFAWLWLLASVQWAVHIEMPLLFPALHRATGHNGPWMASVGSILFAIISATVVALLVALPLKPLWWGATVAFLIGFCAAQIVIGTYVGTSVAYLATYSPLWLFMGWFALCSSVISRHLGRIGSNQAFKPTGHKKPWPAA